MSYDVSSVTLHKDFVGVLANGQKCLPDLDGTVPDVDKKDKNCDECVGVAYASKQGRWIFRCGGKDQSDLCKNIDDTLTYSKTEYRQIFVKCSTYQSIYDISYDILAKHNFRNMYET